MKSKVRDMDSEGIASDLETTVGRDNISTSLFDRISHAVDPVPYDLEEQQIPYVIVKPGSPQEVAEILKYANMKKTPVHIHGSGTALHGAARPKCNCILLDTTRLNSININEDDNYFECGAGTRVDTLSETLDEHGYFLPIFPGSARVATVGGSIAVNTSGHGIDSCMGKPGDYLLGLEVVLPTGERILTGTEGLRRPSGIDLTRLFIGSEGLLGVITRVRMRLVPKPEEAHGVAFFDAVEPIARGVMRLYKEKAPVPLFLEFMDERSAQIGFEINELSPPRGAVAMFEAIGWVEGEASYKVDKILKLFEKERPLEAYAVDDKDTWTKLWQSRSTVGSYIQHNMGAVRAGEVAPALSHLYDAIIDMKKLPETFESVKKPELFLFGHIGSPSVHPMFVMPRGTPNEVRRLFVKEVMSKTEELNLKYRGCGGEWGQTALRTDFYRKKYGNTYFSIVQNMKKMLDPNNILNRGNLEGWM